MADLLALGPRAHGHGGGGRDWLLGVLDRPDRALLSRARRGGPAQPPTHHLAAHGAARVAGAAEGAAVGTRRTDGRGRQGEASAFPRASVALWAVDALRIGLQPRLRTI